MNIYLEFSISNLLENEAIYVPIFNLVYDNQSINQLKPFKLEDSKQYYYTISNNDNKSGNKTYNNYKKKDNKISFDTHNACYPENYTIYNKGGLL